MSDLTEDRVPDTVEHSIAVSALAADATNARRVVLLGLGNLIRSDDGLGIHALQRLAANPRLPAGIEILDGGTLGLQLLPAIEDATHILALDAINTGAVPGTLVRFALTELDPLPGSPSVHQIGFADLLEGLRWMDKLSGKQILLFGIQPDNTTWGDTLSPAVEAALPSLIEAALKELDQWLTQPAPARL